jgi:hypothetical protein
VSSSNNSKALRELSSAQRVRCGSSCENDHEGCLSLTVKATHLPLAAILRSARCSSNNRSLGTALRRRPQRHSTPSCRGVDSQGIATVESLMAILLLSLGLGACMNIGRRKPFKLAPVEAAATVEPTASYTDSLVISFSAPSNGPSAQ